MKIEGRFMFPASPQEVWDLLTDPQSLQHCTPGCKQLNEIASDEFAATMEVGIGPIKGTFHGKILMKEKAPPRSYKLIIEGSGSQPSCSPSPAALAVSASLRRSPTPRTRWRARRRRSARS